MGHSFSEMVFPDVEGNAECIDGNKWVGLYCLVHLYLSMPSCLVHPSLYHIKSLPSFPSLGRSRFFQEALLSLLSPYSSWSAIFTLGSRHRFFCLLFYVLVFAFRPSILGWSLGQRLRWDSWAFPPAECRTWCPGARLSMPSEVLPLWLTEDTLSRVLIYCLSDG